MYTCSYEGRCTKNDVKSCVEKIEWLVRDMGGDPEILNMKTDKTSNMMCCSA